MEKFPKRFCRQFLLKFLRFAKFLLRFEKKKNEGGKFRQKNVIIPRLDARREVQVAKSLVTEDLLKV